MCAKITMERGAETGMNRFKHTAKQTCELEEVFGGGAAEML